MVTRKIVLDHNMTDLETTGNRPGCGILSIGAVMFDPNTGKMGKEFYKVIRRKSCLAFGLFEQAETLEWWAKQSVEAQKVLIQAAQNRGTLNLDVALLKFNEYLAAAGKNVKVWGCGSDFDNVILDAAYTATGIERPWPFWNNRCYRTLKTQAPSVKITRAGTYHNALADAKNQAVHLVQVASHLNLTVY